MVWGVISDPLGSRKMPHFQEQKGKGRRLLDPSNSCIAYYKQTHNWEEKKRKKKKKRVRERERERKLYGKSKRNFRANVGCCRDAGQKINSGCWMFCGTLCLSCNKVERHRTQV